jgi:hypothetical protein
MRIVITVFALGLLAVAPAKSEDAAKSPTPEKQEESNESSMLRDIPMNETFQGLRIPHSGPDGKLIMLLDTKSARRVDEEHVEMDNLRIEFADDDGKTFVVTMPVATFNLTNRVLTGNQKVKIEREDFVIDGDGAEFDTRNRLGKVTGNVKMLIFNTQNLENE